MGAHCADLDPAGQAGAAAGPADATGPELLGQALGGRALVGQALASVCLDGVSADSPLGRRILAELDGLARLQFTAAGAPSGRRWRRTVAGTGLRWWGGVDTGPDAAPAVLRVDLHGTGGPGRRWRIVDATGAPLLQAFHALHACGRPPFIASLFLVECDDADRRGRVLAEAQLSSAVGYRALLDALAAAAACVLRKGVQRADRPVRAWCPEPPPARRALPLARANAAAAVRWAAARLSGDTYAIAFLPRPAADCLEDTILSPAHWATIPAREGFVADPFFWPGRHDVILCEAYAHRTGRGRLASMALPGAAAAVRPVDVLQTGSHLSYPFAWADGDRVLCLPEMASARRQILYELRPGEPMRAVCTVAEDVAMADPTIMREGGRYWLCYTDADRGAYDNLCLMFADRPEGPWRRHPGNPVKMDVRSSRPGGTPFRVNGRLYRPAQDCSRTYGGALAINAVVDCTPTHYAEEVVAMLRPDPAGPFPDGVHTLAVGDGGILIDGKRVSAHPVIAWHKVRRRLRLLSAGNAVAGAFVPSE